MTPDESDRVVQSSMNALLKQARVEERTAILDELKRWQRSDRGWGGELPSYDDHLLLLDIIRMIENRR